MYGKNLSQLTCQTNQVVKSFLSANPHSRLYLTTLLLLALLGMGLVIVSSYAISNYHRGYPYFYSFNHLLSLVLGAVVFFFVAVAPLKWYKSLTIPLFLFSLFLCALVFVPSIGKAVGGAKRWIYFSGINFQPSELLKITMVGMLAFMIAKKREHLHSFTRGIIPLLSVVVISAVLIALEPDFSTSVIIFSTGLFLIFINRIRLTYLLLMFSMVIPILVVLLQTKAKSYLIRRFSFFLADEQPFTQGYQLLQAKKSFRMGGLFGISDTTLLSQPLFPDVHTDFVFAFIARSGGLLMVLLTLVLLILLIYSSVKIGLQQKSTFERNLVLGISFVFLAEILIHIMVNLGLIPTTGSVLPFLSYGRTAMVTHFIMAGIVINIATNSSTEDSLAEHGQSVPINSYHHQQTAL